MNIEEVKVTKITTRELMLKACESTFAGRSNQSLLSMYKSEHSPTRTQLFWIECINIPLYVSTHLLRHHVGSQPFALTHRVDRNGGGLNLEEVARELRDMIKDLSHIEKDSDDEIALHHDLDQLINAIETRGGRNTPTNLSLLINAQSLIDMAKSRLCHKASDHTRKIFNRIKDEVGEIDLELANMLVRSCIYRNGICGESQPCGFNRTLKFKRELEVYLANFSQNQFNKQ